MSEELRTTTSVDLTAEGEASATVTATPENTALDAVRAKLTEYGADPTVCEAVIALGVDSLEDLAIAKESDLSAAGMKVIKARKMLSELCAEETPAAPAMAPAMPVSSYLIAVPDDQAWLMGLKTGGILKVTQDSVIAAIRAAIADVINVKTVMKNICDLIEKHYADDDAAVSETYWTIKKMSTRRDHRDIFDLINGATSVTDAQRANTVKKVRSILFPALIRGQQALSKWQDMYDKNTMRPNIIVQAFANARSGFGSGIQVPDMGMLRDAADQIRDAANKALSGIGAAAASTIAVDYQQIQKVLSMDGLPAECGCTSREQLFNQLGINVSSALVRMEMSLVQYSVSFFASDTISAVNEAEFWNQLWQLGTQIDWTQLGDVSATGIDEGVTSITGKSIL